MNEKNLSDYTEEELWKIAPSFFNVGDMKYKLYIHHLSDEVNLTYQHEPFDIEHFLMAAYGKTVREALASMLTKVKALNLDKAHYFEFNNRHELDSLIKNINLSNIKELMLS